MKLAPATTGWHSVDTWDISCRNYFTRLACVAEIEKLDAGALLAGWWEPSRAGLHVHYALTGVKLNEEGKKRTTTRAEWGLGVVSRHPGRLPKTDCENYWHEIADCRLGWLYVGSIWPLPSAWRRFSWHSQTDLVRSRAGIRDIMSAISTKWNIGPYFPSEWGHTVMVHNSCLLIHWFVFYVSSAHMVQSVHRLYRGVCISVRVCVCVCVFMCACLCACPYVCMPVCLCVCLRCIFVYVFVCIRVYVCVCVSVSMSVCLWKYLCLCPCLYSCIYVCTCMCVFVSVYMPVCVSASMFVSLCICLSLFLCVYIYLCISVFVSAFMAVFMSVRVCLCLCLCISLSVCLCLCLCMCVFVCACLLLSVCLCFCLSVGLCLCLYVCVYVCIFVFMSVPVCVCLYVCVYVCTCMSMPVSMSVCLRIYSCLSIRRACFSSNVIPGYIWQAF